MAKLQVKKEAELNFIKEAASLNASSDKYRYSRSKGARGGAGGMVKIPERRYVPLLAHFDGADEAVAYTAESGQAFTFVSDAALSITEKLYGATSLAIATNDAVTLTKSSDWNFGTDDFTIDIAINVTDGTNAQAFMGAYKDANNYWYLTKGAHAGGDKLKMEFKSTTVQGSYVMTNAWTIVGGSSTDYADATWFQLRFVRHKGTGYIFINGELQVATETTAFGTNDVGVVDGVLTIGGNGTTGFLTGYIDEVRISNIARSIATYTAPTAAWSL